MDLNCFFGDAREINTDAETEFAAVGVNGRTPGSLIGRMAKAHAGQFINDFSQIGVHSSESQPPHSQTYAVRLENQVAAGAIDANRFLLIAKAMWGRIRPKNRPLGIQGMGYHAIIAFNLMGI